MRLLERLDGTVLLYPAFMVLACLGIVIAVAGTPWMEIPSFRVDGLTYGAKFTLYGVKLTLGNTIAQLSYDDQICRRLPDDDEGKSVRWTDTKRTCDTLRAAQALVWTAMVVAILSILGYGILLHSAKHHARNHRGFRTLSRIVCVSTALLTFVLSMLSWILYFSLSPDQRDAPLRYHTRLHTAWWTVEYAFGLYAALGATFCCCFALLCTLVSPLSGRWIDVTPGIVSCHDETPAETIPVIALTPITTYTTAANK